MLVLLLLKQFLVTHEVRCALLSLFFTTNYAVAFRRLNAANRSVKYHNITLSTTILLQCCDKAMVGADHSEVPLAEKDETLS